MASETVIRPIQLVPKDLNKRSFVVKDLNKRILP